MKTSHFVCLFAMLPVTASAQLVTFGFEGGAPAQVPLGQGALNMPFVFGPTVTVRLRPGFLLESGVLLHRLGETRSAYAFRYPEAATTVGSEKRRGSAIEVPLLFKYRFLSERAFQPFVTAGPTIRRTSVDFTDMRTVLSDHPLDSSTGVTPLNTRTSTSWNVDPAAGVGISFRAGRFLLEPEVRYSYWGAGKTTGLRKN
jgi:hypothetical protein